MILLFLVSVFACTPEQIFAYRCKERCAIKGKDFTVKNEACNCLDPEEVGKEVFKVESNIRGKVIQNKVYFND